MIDAVEREVVAAAVSAVLLSRSSASPFRQAMAVIWLGTTVDSLLRLRREGLPPRTGRPTGRTIRSAVEGIREYHLQRAEKGQKVMSKRSNRCRG